MSEYVVIRPFSGPSGDFQKGQIVDTTGWRERNLRQLVERRYVEPVSSPPQTSVASLLPRRGKE